MFKAHKTFPRRNGQTNRLSHSLRIEQIGVREEDRESYKSSEQIRSWIPEPSSSHTTSDHDLPLTPPINLMDHDDERWIEEKILADGIIATSYQGKINGMTTPVVQRSPPTPEITPPRAQNGIRALAPTSSGETSLHAVSFETARENISSEDEIAQVDSPSLHPAQQSWLRHSGRTKLKDIGLGLGLESEDDDPTPTEMTPRNPHKKYNLDVSHAPWLERKDVIDRWGIREEDHGLAKFDLGRRKLPIRQRFPTHPGPRSPKLRENVISSPARSQSLRERVEKSQQKISPSTERFAEQIDWPMKEKGIDIDARLREVDNRRFSQISATSTVVEAIVIDKPPQRRQTLRHTGKISAMTVQISQQNQSNRSSMISNSSTRRRLPRHVTPDREPRRSVATDASGSRNSSLAKTGQEIIPVIVIPKRRSSLKSSAPARREVSKTTSLTFPRQQSSRPTTAPEEATGYFDLPHHERRIVSAVLPSINSPKFERQVADKTPPPILRLTPSEPSSDEVSKIISLPSANITTQMQLRSLGQSQPVLHLSEPMEVRGINLDRSVLGEWPALRPRSALVTPFSVRSTHSSTPGTLEVNEATAISIYPHTNKSILVVQQMARGNSNDPLGHSAIITGNANIALPGSNTPAMIQQARRPLNSPLKNPRDPPLPPDFKVIPPTPANAPPTDETDSKNSASNPAKTRLSGPMSRVKRALSTRRYSESFVSPLTRPFSRRNTIANHPSVGGDPDSKLHPFWRPRTFWDDFPETSSDSDSEFGNSGLLVGDSVDAQLLCENSISQSPNRRGPGRSISLTRRLTRSFSLRSNNINTHPTRTHTRSCSEGYQHPISRKLKLKKSSASLENNRSYEFLPQLERKRAGGMMPRLGYRVQFVGFKGLAQRMEKAKVRREEGKRERVREKLRGSIGVVRVGDGGLISGGMNDMRR